MLKLNWLFPGKKRFDNFVETTLNSLAYQWYLSVTGKLPTDQVTDRNVLVSIGDLNEGVISLKPASGEGDIFTIKFVVQQVCITSFLIKRVQIRFGQNFEGTGKFFVRKDDGSFGGVLLDSKNVEWMAHVVNGTRSTKAFGDILQTHLMKDSHVFVPVAEAGDISVEGWQPPKVGESISFGRVWATVLRSMRVRKGWLVMIDCGYVSTVLMSPDGDVLRWDVAWKIND